jgi:hypothetical protein
MDLKKDACDLDNDNECLACFLEKPNMLFFPCKHMCMCQGCFDKYKKNICILCKSDIHEIRIINDDDIDKLKINNGTFIIKNTNGKNINEMGELYVLDKISNNFQDKSQEQPAWIKRLGHSMIKSVEIQIGDETIDRIDEHYNDWANIWHQLSNNAKN